MSIKVRAYSTNKIIYDCKVVKHVSVLSMKLWKSRVNDCGAGQNGKFAIRDSLGLNFI